MVDIANFTGRAPIRKAGFWSVLIGAVALVLVFMHIVGPTLEPKPSVATQIGEIAGEIKRSAWQALLDKASPKPAAQPVPVWNYVAIAAPVLGIAALVLSLISVLMRENWRYAAYGAGLGIAAIVFQFVWWILLLVLGVFLLVAIIENIGDIFSA